MLAEAPPGNATARARAALGNHLVHTDPMAAFAEVERAVEDAADPALLLRLEAGLLEALLFVDPTSACATGSRGGMPSLAAVAAAATTARCAGCRARAHPLCERALAGGALLARSAPRARPGTSSPTRCASPRTRAARSAP